jgi:DNA-binding winged helix-turn-helix (wHTH) protein
VIRLERIPLEILVLLVEHKDEVVTRDAIVSRVWGNGVFLDTDNSIRGAVRKLRQALKDDVGSPRFIQTVTGQGYRFVAAVTSAEEAGTEITAAETPAAHVSGPSAVLDSDFSSLGVQDQDQDQDQGRSGNCPLPKWPGQIGMPERGFLPEWCRCSRW